MSDTADVDPEELRSDLDQIKDALGLRERHPAWPLEWLLFGVAVGLGGLLSQVVALRDLPSYYHSVVWVGLIGTAWVASYWLHDGREPAAPAPETRPSVGFVYGAIFLAAVALSVLLQPLVASDAAGPAVLFGLIVVLVGTAYLVVGQVLRAHRVRRRDRLAFYAGAAWMVPLGAAVGHVDVLQTYVYGVYGGVYLAYALASYWVLART